LENAFTTAFKELKPVAQFRLTAKLGSFLSQQMGASFHQPSGLIEESAEQLLAVG
jgi:hypothetical protein